MKINYGLMAVVEVEDGLGVLHFCGYAEPPTDRDRDSLAFELQHDEEFGLVGRTDYVIIEAPESLVRQFDDEY